MAKRSSRVRRAPRRKLHISRRKQRWISRKIRLLRHEGYKQRRAIAIAYRMAGVARPIKRRR